MAQNPFFSSSRIPPAVLGVAASVFVAATVVLVFEATLGTINKYQNDILHLPVINDRNIPIGMVSEVDLMDHLLCAGHIHIS